MKSPTTSAQSATASRVIATAESYLAELEGRA